MTTIEKLLLTFIVVLIGIGIYSLTIIKNEGTACLVDPVKFTVDILKSQTTNEVFCTCSSGDKIISFGTNMDNEIIFNTSNQDLISPTFNISIFE